jgi:plastocyanin
MELVSSFGGQRRATTRRAFLAAGGFALVGLGTAPRARASDRVEVQMHANEKGDQAWFDPIGLWLKPGQTVRWVIHHDAHTTTAYHPKNDNHSLRIPEGANPWDSDFLMKKGATFDVTFTVEGVYDYFCLPHEDSGMVGRIVVGRPGGPGTLPFDYFKGKPDTAKWKPVPAAARKAFPSIAQIEKAKVVRRQAPKK